MINLEYYRIFYTIARTGSLTAAAKELFVTQPALSQSLNSLERQLGGQLFVRTPRGMVLTPEGEALLRYVEQGLNIFEQGQNRFDEMKHLSAGNIRIGASDTLCRHFLLPYIRRFHGLYPEIGIHITNRTTPETITLLRAGQVDAAFVNLPADTHEFDTRERMRLQDCFVAAGQYQPSKPLTPQEFCALPLIMIESSSNTRQTLDRFMLSLGVRPKPEFELGSFDLVVDFAKAGLGIGCVTREFVKDELHAGTLFEVSTTFTVPPRAIGSVTRREVPLTFAAARFMELVKEG